LEGRWLPSVLHVGPGEQYAVPSQAAAVAKDGDDVQIDAGLYTGDVAVWRANNLTIEGVGGLAHLDGAGHNAEGKGIWVIQGDNTTVSNIEFSGATVPDQNGAGIRPEGAGLTVLSCYFHDNQEGILTGANLNSDIVIAYSEFANNGDGDGYSHNMYIGNVRSFILFGSYSHDAVVGHEVKSRAQVNYILYNRIQEGDSATASYDIDLPNGGLNYIIGNVVRKGPRAQNSTVITSGEEGATNPVQEFYFINNTIVNDRGNGTFVRVNGNVPTIRLVNNIFAGRFAVGSTILSGNSGEQTTNLRAVDPGFVDAANFDYHLAGGSAAIDAGTPPGTANDGTDLTPTLQYVDQASVEDRPDDGAIDIGAYEYVAADSLAAVVIGGLGSPNPGSDNNSATVRIGHADSGAPAAPVASTGAVAVAPATGNDSGKSRGVTNHLSLASPPTVSDQVFASGSDLSWPSWPVSRREVFRERWPWPTTRGSEPLGESLGVAIQSPDMTAEVP
jgi:hypothetical protein